MTLDYIKAQIQKIRDYAKDDPWAHLLEDQLRAEFIAWVMKSFEDTEVGMKAKLVLSTDRIEFERRT